MKFKKCNYCKKYHRYYFIRTDYCITRLHEAYRNMIKRCYDPRIHKYEYYGGRGIWVCSEWRNNRNTFKRWALNNGYQDNLTLNRIVNSSIYSPKNCDWLTWEENNRRSPYRSRKTATLLH